jgi:hypothetical protein
VGDILGSSVGGSVGSESVGSGVGGSVGSESVGSGIGEIARIEVGNCDGESVGK